MQLRPSLQLQSVLKSLNDVVLPALDPNDKLAREQGQLVVSMLKLLAERLPLQYRYDCDQLSRLVDFSAELEQCSRGGSRTQAALKELTKARAGAADVVDRARAEPKEVEDAVCVMKDVTSALLQAVFADGDAASNAAVPAVVMKMSEAQIIRDRAWLIAQGWDPDPKNVPPIETLLAPVNPSERTPAGGASS